MDVVPVSEPVAETLSLGKMVFDGLALRDTDMVLLIDAATLAVALLMDDAVIDLLPEAVVAGVLDTVPEAATVELPDGPADVVGLTEGEANTVCA